MREAIGVAEGGSLAHTPHMQAQSGTLAVTNRYRWLGGPHQGSFAVYIDRQHVADIAPGQTVQHALSAGSHRIRVRRHWYASPGIAVVIEPGHLTELSADIASSLSIARRFALMLFTPTKSLVLSADEPSASRSTPESVLETRRTAGRVRYGLLAQAITGGAGAVLIIVGSVHNIRTVIAMGWILFVVGAIIGVTVVGRSRPGRSRQR